MDDEEGKQGADGSHVAEQIDWQDSRKDGSNETNKDGGNIRSLEPRMDFGKDIRQKTVPGHGEENTRLTEQHDKQHGGQTKESTERNDNVEPAETFAGA